MTPLDTDTQDIFVEDASVKRTVVRDAIVVKGRREPFVFETEITDTGIVIAVDRQKGRFFTLSWRGREPGAAAELGALALGRAGSGSAFREALRHWKMPARRVTFADVAGGHGVHDAALRAPLRRPAASDRAGASPPTAQAVFVHPLAISAGARQRFNVGPVERARDDSTVQISLDAKDWDRSRAVTAPGQSESPSSAHFADLAKRWATGDAVPLVFSDAAIAANAEATLTLVPRTVQAK
jgi:acyl-homoserine lactone acylase PvdQ